MIYRVISQIYIFMLMVNAGWVAYGLTKKKNMWKWICLYWIILTFKNAVDFINAVGAK